MAATYDRLGVRFMHPENWTVSEEQADEFPLSVTLQSPGGAFWTLHIYQRPINMPALVEEGLEAMRSLYEGLEFEAASDRFAGHDARGYDMNFFCLDFVVTAKSRGVLTDERGYLLLYQAESRDFDALEPVFQAMAVSLLSPGGVASMQE
jgi:hypothetical protein